MKLLAWRLVLTALLFVGWLGYLGYLVATRPLTASGTPLVLSRPQIMTSQIDIVADISDPSQEVVVRQILYPPNAPIKVGQKLEILDLDQCRPLRRRGEEKKTADDFTGAGPYVIPLRASDWKKGAYEVASIPLSPGFDPKRMGDSGVRIYPYTPEAIEQYLKIAKPRP